MCGLAGIISLSDAFVDKSELFKMLEAQKHRGPDDAGFVMFSLRSQSFEEVLESDEPYSAQPFDMGIGFNRLAIQDLSSEGHQPMFTADGSIFLTFNGEIYNADNLKKDLETQGYVFKSTSDTEVLLCLYQQYGIKETLKRINGMFAFCIVDLSDQVIYCVRDRFGIKPLYIYQNDEVILFSSEVKSFYAHRNFEGCLSESDLDEYLLFKYCAGNNYLLRGVTQLMPGEIAVFSEGKLSFESYWSFEHNQHDVESDSLRLGKFELDSELRKAVGRQLVSDVPLGSQLSGGVDSSLITKLAAETTNGAMEAFSIVFADQKVSEDPWITGASAAAGVHSHRYMFKVSDLVHLLELATWHLDQPINLPNTIAIFLLAKKSRENVTVLLSGEGADELMGGYSRHYDALVREKIVPLWPILRKLPWLRSRLDRKFLLNHSAETAFLLSSRTQDPDEILKLRPSFSMSNALAGRRKILSRVKSHGLRKLLDYDMATYMVDLLIRQDKMTMASSLENRVPFLDFDLVDLIRRFTDRQLVKISLTSHRKTKIILKELAANYFGAPFVDRKKVGFPLPLSEFFEHDEFRTYVENKVMPSLKKRDIVNISIVEGYWNKAMNGDKASIKKLWPILSLEIWATIFVDNQGQRPKNDLLNSVP